MQVMRREWIDEGRPRHPLDDDSHMIPVEDKRDEVQKDKQGMDADQNDARPGDKDESEPKDASKETDQISKERKDVAEHRSIFGGDSGRTDGNSLFLSDNEEEDDLDALLAEQSSMPSLNNAKDVTEHKSIFGGGTGKTKGDSLFLSDNEEEDDLDALLAEQSSMPGLNNTVQDGKANSGQELEKPEDDFDDEMEAMAGMDDW
jgi:replication fork protection complex subunit Csm3/Swi3